MIKRSEVPKYKDAKFGVDGWGAEGERAEGFLASDTTTIDRFCGRVKLFLHQEKFLRTCRGLVDEQAPKFINAICRQSGWSLRRLARELDCSAAYLCDVRATHRSVSAKMAKRMTRLAVSIAVHGREMQKFVEPVK